LINKAKSVLVREKVSQSINKAKSADLVRDKDSILVVVDDGGNLRPQCFTAVYPDILRLAGMFNTVEFKRASGGPAESIASSGLCCVSENKLRRAEGLKYRHSMSICPNILLKKNYALIRGANIE